MQSIHLKNISLSFNFSSSLDISLTRIPTKSVFLEIEPDNNHYAMLYSQNTYSKQKILSILYSFMSISSIVLYFLSLFLGGKRVIV